MRAGSERKDSSMSEQNKAIARQVIEEVFSKGRVDLLEQCYSPDYVGHDPVDPEDTRGIEGMRERVAQYRGAFSDMRVTTEDCFAEGDRVATRWTVRGTHDGDLMGIAPTGKQFVIDGLTIDRFEDGKIVETWDNWDALGLMQQLGAIPEEQAAR